MPTNRLAKEKSPYLLQHAHNPVDWYPWGNEAFSKAKHEKKLIFLSVGYSTCHYCHVMEKESFENEDIAEVMNKEFVCVKVDREERPHIDKLYMTYVQSMNMGQGGWPMSVWLTPDLRPIFAGTYYPPVDRFGQIGFTTVIMRVISLWKLKRDAVQEKAEKVADHIKEYLKTSRATNKVPGKEVLKKCFEDLAASYDVKWGGFGDAPKFARPVALDFLFAYYALAPTEEDNMQALYMALQTLKAMAKGGIRDHVGLGFHRYSTDKYWNVPHFEKMLYDQASLAVSYMDGYRTTKQPFYREISEEILKYVLRDLTDSHGGFYCGEDADSFPTVESTTTKEGAFCVWTFDELKAALEGVEGVGQDTLFDVFCYHYDLQANDNIMSYYGMVGDLDGKIVLRARSTVDETANAYSVTVDQTKELLVKGREILWAIRQKRPHPHRDDKILVAWNGMMISALAKASIVFGEDQYKEAAIKAATFIKDNMTGTSKGKDISKLVRTYRDGSSKIAGFADDYAFLIHGLLDLYEATNDNQWLQWAVTLQQSMDALFWDSNNGGYWGSAESPDVMFRFKEDYDGSEASPNSVAALNLQRMAALTKLPPSSPHVD
eukprot:Ihof_evm30s2 gene=Ihof_evmTU30s2